VQFGGSSLAPGRVNRMYQQRSPGDDPLIFLSSSSQPLKRSTLKETSRAGRMRGKVVSSVSDSRACSSQATPPWADVFFSTSAPHERLKGSSLRLLGARQERPQGRRNVDDATWRAASALGTCRMAGAVGGGTGGDTGGTEGILLGGVAGSSRRVLREF
jgi:hypothetical protein